MVAVSERPPLGTAERLRYRHVSGVALDGQNSEAGLPTIGTSMIQKISLTTDFSAEGTKAFQTALALAVFYRARLEILHVSHPDEEPNWGEFPRVRDTLATWGLLPPDARQEDVEARLGVDVVKASIRSKDAAAGIAGFLLKHPPDLFVAASHGRTGINWWLAGSVALETLNTTRIPALLLGPASRAVVDQGTGRLSLGSVLFPVATSPSPIEALGEFTALMGYNSADVSFIHVTEQAGEASWLGHHFPNLCTLQGEVVTTILGAARDISADMIVMPTAGRHGFVDALRGSVTQRVLREAPCPVLALSA